MTETTEHLSKRHIISNVDQSAKTCDCSRCGPNVRLRVRLRDGHVRLSCRGVDRLAPRRRSLMRGGTAVPESRTWIVYGMTEEEYEVRLAAQGGRCLICQEAPGRLFIDHSHALGHVRGLLCHYCNAGLGFFRDDPAALARAAKYVRRYLDAS